MAEQITAVIAIEPAKDEAVMALVHEIIDFRGAALQVQIVDDDGAKRVTNDLTIAASLRKAMEEHRATYVGPLNEHIKNINNAFKMFTVPLGEGDGVLRGKLLTYKQYRQRLEDEKAELDRLLAEVAVREASLNGKAPPVVEALKEEPLSAMTRADLGTASTMKTKKWAVENMDLVPREYLVLNTTLIGKNVRAGIPSIPGIRIYVEETLQVTAAPQRE